MEKELLRHVEKTKKLIHRLNRNLADYNSHLMSLDKGEIIRTAQKISDTQTAHRYMTEKCRSIDEHELDFLLNFVNPLEVVANYLHTRHGYDLLLDYEVSCAITDICDKQDALVEYPLVTNTEIADENAE